MVVASWDMGKLSLGYCKTCLVIVCTGINIDPFETPVIGIGCSGRDHGDIIDVVTVEVILS